MARIVSNFFISLDGVVERPDQWHFPYFDDEMGAAVGRGVERATAFLMGRKQYQDWAGYWPNKADGDDGGFAGFINSVPKYVLSNTLTEATWRNSTVLSGDSVAARLREIKERSEGEIAMSGSATTVRWLLANGLLDELRLLVHPIAVGSGQRLFEEAPTYPLRLLSSETFKSGVLNLAYAPA
ncbi:MULTISPECIES: dihydrofolate reductase family protein [Micromonospora]|uniref:Dihydrofolate reductase n=1 Tax=Micromonospora solifontis TaxID=2487138 RepID=A0ABX9WE28_9ACTN|nr:MULTISPECIES: dihydrofolate reductase family protein [Micromonospora]NES14202.1 dihydrofolate reductase family protein [Micromonospora sp. PPF5-17B]NES37638.1 dihydrofolate reductase family protein [Micromonospora solifontis]NES55849.1 dihydrofolate reductase family protein [Micromonospora sp. PPF5-6]RNL98084.1 dihydrofolate reductase [Micromonospora solifontis]